jgi:PAS domain S-box-containing protein
MPGRAEADEVESLRARIAALEQQLVGSQQQAASAACDAAYWRRVVEAVPEPVSILDRDARFVYINRLDPDYRGEDFIGRSLAEIVDPQYWQAAFASAVENGEFTTYEAHDEHRQHWFRCRVGPFTADDGQTQIVAITHDIDQQKEAERELKDALELLQSLVSNSPDNIVLLDSEGTVLFINKTTPGYSSADVIGRPGTDFLHPQDRAALSAAIREASETRQPQVFEFEDIRDRVWWQTTLVPVRDSRRGDLVLAISHDVTKARNTEAALRASETRWRLVLEQVPAILWTTDQQLTITSSSGSGLEALHVRESDWKGRAVAEVLGTGDSETRLVAAHRTALAGQSASFDYEWREWAFHVHVEPLRDAAGRISGTIGLALDITTRLQAEDAVKRARDELEQRVAERTLELDRANQSLRDDIAARRLVEQQLRDSEERFRIIADTVPVAIVITRLSDGLVVYVNHRLAELFQTPAAELLGHYATDFYVEPEERESLMDRLRESRSILDLELWLQSPTGKRMLVSGNYQPIVFDGEECVLTGFVDLTKRIEIEKALLAERRLLKRLLELHERDRQLISYELHDGIVQDMTASLMFFESSRPVELTEEHSTHEAYVSGVRLLRGSIHEARRLINGLQPPVLEDEGVVAAIMTLVADVERDAGIAIELVTDVKFQRLAPALEMAIYRIAQEGLNNVWHHSRSTRARVELIQRDDTIDIRVQDWGIGFDPTKVSKRRYGLTGMRERARLLNGRAIVKSAPGAGTTLLVELPLIDALMPTTD